MITLAFAAPAGLAGASFARVSEPLALGQTSGVPSGLAPGALRLGGESVAGRDLARILARVDSAMESVKRQESALAALLEVEKPDDVRDREERLNRRREVPPISGKA
ncbi:MAG: hypothetical protein AUJ49_05560 [Desulfovibrionaceae bacterium CG1_02_65_16]|nr:MAG: hypothetical protein AUJ49_05560 [Desulfovibrionaceae bacterium CG1_02_65_16]